MNFTESVYYREKFSKLVLENEKITLKVFEECEFVDCNLINCRFEKCKFLTCTFSECIISALTPLDCRFNEVNFKGCKVIGVDWTKTQYLKDLNFAGCQVNYSNFKLLKISRIKLVDCEAKEVDYSETDLSQGDFRNTDFENSLFFKTNLSGADFRGAKNYYIDVKNNTIKKARFSLPEAIGLLKSLDISLD
jgi:fluoroquinolone resistance protein